MSDDVERQLKDLPSEFPRPAERMLRRGVDRVRALAAPADTPPRRFRQIVALAVALASGCVVGWTASSAVANRSAGPDDPVLVVREIQRGPDWSAVRFVQLSGRVPSGRAGEIVQILERWCGEQELRIVTDTQTGPGGLFSLEEMSLTRGLEFRWSGAFVARWNGRYSDEVAVRPPLYAFVRPWGRGKWRIEVRTGQQNLSGRPIVLQRRTREAWVRLGTWRLRRAEFRLFAAVVSVKKRGLKVRVFIPESTARPCFDPNVSFTWTS